MITFCLHVLALGSFTDVNGEHDNFGSHGGHLVAKAKFISAIHMSSHRVFPTGLTVSFINLLSIWSSYLKRRKT